MEEKTNLLNEIVYKAAFYAKSKGIWFPLVYLRGEKFDQTNLSTVMASCRKRDILCETLMVERAQRIDGTGHLNVLGHDYTATSIANFMARHDFFSMTNDGAMSLPLPAATDD